MKHKIRKSIKHKPTCFKKINKNTLRRGKIFEKKIHKYQKMEKQVISKIKRKKSRKRHRGGSVVSDMVLQSTMSNCNNPNTVSNFPKLNGGGSDWISTHNSFSVGSNDTEQFGKFTSTWKFITRWSNGYLRL